MESQKLQLLARLKESATPEELAVAMRHCNPQVRSKAALVVGKENRDAGWVRARLRDPDARVRANAVESLWGADGVEVVDVFRQAALDDEPRVVLNGVMGLYRARLTEAVEMLVKLAESEDFRFRRSACWVMGQTKDPRFLGALLGLARDKDANLRAAALQGVAAIRLKVNRLRRERLGVTVVFAARRERRREFRVWVEDTAVELDALSFVVEEAGVLVTRFEVEGLGGGEYGIRYEGAENAGKMRITVMTEIALGEATAGV
ncbi:MAG: HEAT repeat domain-containing protein [Acidobacteria bacterium]|nr:HEAT repeat domain-containing protein [Acidobacteriota bacterium]